jgi:hypothetical protein
MIGRKTRASKTPEKKPPKVLRNLTVTPAENGVSVEHNFEHYDYPSETHVFGHDEKSSFSKHMLKHAMPSTSEPEGETGGNIPEEK